MADPLIFEAGDEIRLIAPAGCFPRENFEIGVALLRSWGLVPRYRTDIFDTDDYLAGSDNRRADELEEALSDPNCRALLAVRGGYGCTRLLPRLDDKKIKAFARPIIGFSDITALHQRWEQAGIPSIHADNLNSLSRRRSEIQLQWKRELEFSTAPSFQLQSDSPNELSGILSGGNLTLLHQLAAAGQLGIKKGSILFLEDIAEPCYRLDRMLEALEAAGHFKEVQGILLGTFHQCAPSPSGTSATELFKKRFKEFKIPIFCSLPCGHGEENRALHLGRQIRLSRQLSAHPGQTEANFVMSYEPLPPQSCSTLRSL